MFHSKKPEGFQRYRVVDSNTLQVISSPVMCPAQRVYQNREIQDLFARYRTTKSFIARDQLVPKLEKSLGGKVKAFTSGPRKTKKIGIITGGAGAEIYRVAEDNIDTFITGEAPHWAAVAADELSMNLLLGGHYATETFGVKALGAHLAERFNISWTFIDCPTGM